MSDNKFWLGIWITISVVAIFIAGLMYNYNVKSIPLDTMRVRSEHVLKLACIQQGGRWEAIDHDNHAPYGCTPK